MVNFGVICYAATDTWGFLGGSDGKESACNAEAAAAAKSLQSCLTLCDPINGSPPGFPVPGILQARILEWVAIAFSGEINLGPDNFLSSATPITIMCAPD